MQALVKKLREDFYAVSDEKIQLSSEPGFNTTLSMMNDLLDDGFHRFREGRKNYAFWRLRGAANYCITCHTRIESPLSFKSAGADLSSATDFERGEFYFATRQFDLARKSFLRAARDPKAGFRRMDALRKWLIVYTRVQPNPMGAIKELGEIRNSKVLSSYEQTEVKDWLTSLRRWQNESKASKVKPLRRAENLVRQGIGMHDPLTGHQSVVELLRATSILHKLLESLDSEKESVLKHFIYLAYLTVT